MHRRYVLNIFLCAVLASSVLADQVLIEDFETGVGEWETLDGLAAQGEPASLCNIYPVARPAPQEGGRQSALVEFLEGNETWALVRCAVKGAAWVQNNCNQLSLWMKGDGTPQKLTVVLKVFPPDKSTATEYKQTLTVKSTQWQRFSLRFFGFVDDSGKSLTSTELPWVRYLELARYGSWPASRFYVDQIVAEPTQTAGLAPSPPTETSVVIDFSMTQARLLGQIGVQLDPAAAALIDEGGPAEERLGEYLANIGPCVVLVRLNNYFNSEQKCYDVDRLTGHLDWIERHNARWMLSCRPPAAAIDDAGQETELWDIFYKTCIEVAESRTGAPTSHYYELFPEPLESGQYANIEAALEAYNTLATDLKQADPGPYAYVGGMGFASADRRHISEFVKAARWLDFLSYHFFSGHTAELSDEEALASARTGEAFDLSHQVSFPEVRALVARLRPELRNLFITDLWMGTAAVYPRGDSPRDYFAAAWLATVTLVAAPTHNKVICHSLCGEHTGLLDPQGHKTALYHAAWLLRHWAPAGAELCHYSNPLPEVLAAGIRTKTSNTAVIAYGGEGPRKVHVQARGEINVARLRVRKLDPSSPDIQVADRPAANEAEVTFTGPGVAVVQFIPW